jgi:Putative restriction endonuclease
MSILIGNPLLPPPFPVRRFTLDEYHQMIQKGILQEDDPVELLDGWIVLKMPRNPRHDVTVNKVADVLMPILPSGWQIRIQSAITIDSSEPEPDGAIVPGPPERYLSHHPRPQDIAVLIEVADSSLDHDREKKGKIYSRSRIPTYWIVNLVDDQVEVYSRPSGPNPSPAYGEKIDYGVSDSIPLILSGKEVAQVPVKSLLPITNAPNGQPS